MPDVVWAEVMSKMKLQDICRTMGKVSKEMRHMIDEGPVFPRLRGVIWNSRQDTLWEALAMLQRHYNKSSSSCSSSSSDDDEQLEGTFSVVWQVFAMFEDHVAFMESDASYWKPLEQSVFESFTYQRHWVSRQQLLFETFIFLLTNIADISICDSVEKGYKITWKPLYREPDQELLFSVMWFGEAPQTFQMVATHSDEEIISRNVEVTLERFPYELIHLAKCSLYGGFWPIAAANSKSNMCTCGKKNCKK